MAKWIIGGVLLLAILVITGLTAHKSVRAEIVINASPEEVWSVITDPQTYGEWNPIFVAYEGVFAEGNRLELQMKMGEGDATPVQVLVKEFVPNAWMHQGGGYPVILTYDHNWRLEPVPGGTRVIQHEDYTGLYVYFWDPAPAQRAYEQGNANLKARLEDTNPDNSSSRNP
ncbi:MAG: SRPBCC domain-containing protein [Gammaproteobacteria bacterium]|nr:SRPBCC domain-containing protein [Gammaproteobacteria bacterium]